MESKYVKLEHFEELLSLIRKRDAFYDWSKEYKEYNEKVRNTIDFIRRNAKPMKEDV